MGGEEKNCFSFGELKINALLCKRKAMNVNMNILDKNIGMVVALCKMYKVKDMFVFGSVLTDKFTNESDIDLLVDFNTKEIDDYFTNFFDLKYALQDLLGRDVDLVENSAIKNVYFRRNVDANKRRIYGG